MPLTLLSVEKRLEFDWLSHERISELNVDIVDGRERYDEMKNKFLKAWGSILLILSVAFVTSTRWASVEVTKALEFLTYSAFLITIPILVFYVIVRAFLKAYTNEEG